MPILNCICGVCLLACLTVHYVHASAHSDKKGIFFCPGIEEQPLNVGAGNQTLPSVRGARDGGAMGPLSHYEGGHVVIGAVVCISDITSLDHMGILGCFGGTEDCLLKLWSRVLSHQLWNRALNFPNELQHHQLWNRAPNFPNELQQTLQLMSQEVLPPGAQAAQGLTLAIATSLLPAP